MIQIMILICAALAYYFAVFIQNKKVGYSVATVFIVLFVGSIVLLVGNEYGHYGMEKVTTQKNIPITTVKKGSNVLIYANAGTSGKEKIYVYRTPDTENAKKPLNTKKDVHVINKVKVGNYDIAKIDQQTTRWEYKNDFYAFLFNLSKNNHEFIKQTNTFKVNQTWLVMTDKQAAAMQKKMKDKNIQAQMKQEGEAYVKQVVAQQMAANPSISKAQLVKVEKQAQQEYQLQQAKKILKTLDK